MRSKPGKWKYWSNGIVVLEKQSLFYLSSTTFIASFHITCGRTKYWGQVMTEFGNLPRQISTPMIPEDIERFYQLELDWSISFMSKHKNVGVEKLKKLLIVIFSPIPPIAADNIASFAISIRKQSPTIGLPLFEKSNAEMRAQKNSIFST